MRFSSLFMALMTCFVWGASTAALAADGDNIAVMRFAGPQIVDVDAD